MKKNFISLLFVSAITVGLLSACSSAPADDNAHSIFYAPQYVAIENGYFADEGINLTLVTGFGVV